MKVKELTVNPGQSLSMQRHDLRAEYWIVSEGTAHVYHSTEIPPTILTKHEDFHIMYKMWHQLVNPGDVPLKIVEIQYGTDCIEEDIERV
jgi:mannose-6-phosphate isomerase-like protein (cupin superfamily)